MINFEALESNLETLRTQYLAAQPFPHLILDHFCEEEKLDKAYASIPELENKSRDYAFANNKFEKSNYNRITSYNVCYTKLLRNCFSKSARRMASE